MDKDGKPSGGGGGGAGVGGKRKTRENETKNKDSRVRGPIDPTGGLILQGHGPNQPKPEKNAIGKTTLDIAPDLHETREQATEALRNQKVPAAQRDVVSEFYKNLTPEKRSGPERK
jgi:hypothetical protein